MPILPNKHRRPDSHEKQIIRQLKRIISQGKPYTFKQLQRRLAELNTKATLKQISDCCEMLSTNEHGFMISEEQVGETKRGQPVYRYQLEGIRQTHANH